MLGISPGVSMPSEIAAHRRGWDHAYTNMRCLNTQDDRGSQDELVSRRLRKGSVETSHIRIRI